MKAYTSPSIRPHRASREATNAESERKTTHLIGKHHQSIIRLSSQYTPDTLSCMAHGVEGEEVVLADSVGVAKVFEARFEDARFGVLLSEVMVGRRKGVRCRRGGKKRRRSAWLFSNLSRLFGSLQIDASDFNLPGRESRT